MLKLKSKEKHGKYQDYSLKQQSLFRMANISGYLLFSSILVIILLSIIAITIVINAKKTNKLCWANVGLFYQED